MARIREVRLVDDLDGSDAVETLGFGLDGATFEIDLSAEHAAQLRAAVAPYRNAARRTAPAAQRHRGTGDRRPRRDASEIREWARLQGMTVSDRGRVPSKVLAAFENRHERTAQSVARSEATPATSALPQASPLLSGSVTTPLVADLA
ncbi:MAG: hypothetical protein ABS81_06960 [Pseudonocardia sp. SCN 72-86]|nr:MAG: hypothetical protein ABS81_06960 [Pseudonocardia sp. SCN 72-86]